MEADDVVREQAAEDVLADARGQHAPGVGLRPGDVDEVVQEDVGPRAADEVGKRVEVVVVNHHHRLGVVAQLLHDGSREVFVDHVVAELEGLDLLAPDVGGVGEVPEVVLDEPQHRVREDVVEAVVGLRVGDDEPQVVLAAAGCAHREGAASVLLGDSRVVVGHRGGDPEGLAMRGEPGERGHEATGAALCVPLGVVCDGPTVRDQDQRRLALRGAPVLSAGLLGHSHW